MNWEDFKKWCETSPLKNLLSLIWQMSGGDFRYYDNHQHDDGFYDNWRDFDRRRKYVNKKYKERENANIQRSKH